MSSLSAEVNVTAKIIMPDTSWVRLEQADIKKETANIEKVAELVNRAYKVDPCHPTKSEGAISFSEFADAVKDIFDLSLCDTDPNGETHAKVKVILSSPNDPYVLRAGGAGVVGGATIIEEMVSLRIPVNNAVGEIGRASCRERV